MILDEIVAWKRQEVDAARRATPLERLEAEAARATPARPFLETLRRPKDDDDAPVRVIAEIKKASPSKGVIRADFEPRRIARQYRDGGASAVSVLTDRKFFQGGLEIFRDVRATIDLPLLRKEFIIDPYQIVEARAAGADAILLIVAILNDAELIAFREQAEAMGMAALIETHTPDEGRRAARAGARLVGVNNRDLQTFVTDVRHTEAILPALPADAVIVSESGIRSADEVNYLAGLGVDAILVGETLMRMENPGAGVAMLTGGGAPGSPAAGGE